VTRNLLSRNPLSDDEFVAQVEACSYPIEKFKHLDHVRLAWIYLQRHSYQEAESRMKAAIARFASHHGAERKYHVTITVAWMRLLSAAAQPTPTQPTATHPTPHSTFPEFAAAHPWIADKNAISVYYSDHALSSEDARQTWIPPDLKPFPPHPE
jgi:hypothetical protein